MLTPQTDVILRTEDLSKQVMTGQTLLTILEGVTFSVHTAETVAIVGASGSGKSTLLSLLAGLDLPTGGRIFLKNHELNALDEDARAVIRATHVGFVFQSFQLLPSLTALENVMLPLELQNQGAAQEMAMTLLSRLGLADRCHHYPRYLSGGEQQRVALARAFITHPTILFADEVTGNLDTHTGQQIIDILFELNSMFRTTLILVTHDAAIAARCDRVLHLKAGRVD